jgi:hypothetical protein
MRKSAWKDRLFIIQHNGETWATNGHWAMSEYIGQHIKGVKELFNLKPGRYINMNHDGDNTPDLESLLESVTSVATRTVKISQIEIGDSTMLIAEPDTNETEHVVSVQTQYVEVLNTLEGELRCSEDCLSAVVLYIDGAVKAVLMPEHLKNSANSAISRTIGRTIDGRRCVCVEVL